MPVTGNWGSTAVAEERIISAIAPVATSAPSTLDAAPQEVIAMISRSLAPRIPRVAILVASCAAVLAGCGTDQSGASASPVPASSARELIIPRAGLYAEASRFGEMVWTAGHLPFGVDPSASIDDQVSQVLDNLETTLEAAGAGFDTVVKANVYLTSFSDWERFNAVYAGRLEEFGLPPRSTVAVRELGLGYRVEIEMVAHVRGSTP